MDYTFHYMSPLGGITLSSDVDALTGLWFDGQKYFADTLDAEHCEKALPIFDETAEWLDLYFAGIVPDFTPKLSPRGTSFRRRVWDVLLTIPYGQTMTYGQIAKALGCGSAQAVGGAVGHNPIPATALSARAAVSRAMRAAWRKNAACSKWSRL